MTLLITIIIVSSIIAFLLNVVTDGDAYTEGKSIIEDTNIKKELSIISREVNKKYKDWFKPFAWFGYLLVYVVIVLLIVLFTGYMWTLLIKTPLKFIFAIIKPINKAIKFAVLKEEEK